MNIGTPVIFGPTSVMNIRRILYGVGEFIVDVLIHFFFFAS